MNWKKECNPFKLKCLAKQTTLFYISPWWKTNNRWRCLVVWVGVVVVSGGRGDLPWNKHFGFLLAREGKLYNNHSYKGVDKTGYQLADRSLGAVNTFLKTWSRIFLVIYGQLRRLGIRRRNITFPTNNTQLEQTVLNSDRLQIRHLFETTP